MSIDSASSAFPDEVPQVPAQVFKNPGFPEPHPAEADLYDRQERSPGHNQELLAHAQVLIAGAGGLGCWVSVGLLRSGVSRVTFIDHDRFDRTNGNRQLVFSDDLGKPKAFAAPKNAIPHAVGGGEVVGIALTLQEAVATYSVSFDLMLVQVDNNECREFGSRFARKQRKPVIFTMLSRDGTRYNVFLQGPNPGDACLFCALPNLDPTTHMPCADATIASCWVAVAHTIFLAHRTLMGWPEGVEPFTWRSGDLLGLEKEVVGRPAQRPDCPYCGL